MFLAATGAQAVNCVVVELVEEKKLYPYYLCPADEG